MSASYNSVYQSSIKKLNMYKSIGTINILLFGEKVNFVFFSFNVQFLRAIYVVVYCEIYYNLFWVYYKIY